MVLVYQTTNFPKSWIRPKSRDWTTSPGRWLTRISGGCSFPTPRPETTTSWLTAGSLWSRDGESAAIFMSRSTNGGKALKRDGDRLLFLTQHWWRPESPFCWPPLTWRKRNIAGHFLISPKFSWDKKLVWEQHFIFSLL